MTRALLFGLIASSALVAGSLIGTHWRVPKRLLAVMLAFAGGALIAALSYELFDEAFRQGGAVTAGGALLAGAAAFIALDELLLDRFRKLATGLALLVAVTLDGIPENLALGTTLVTDTGSLALLVAIFVSNFPEALVGASKMRQKGQSVRAINLIWLATAVLLAGAVAGGASLFAASPPGTLSMALGFAAGAVLASLADTVMPEAYRDGGPLVAFATVAGFFVSFMLNTI